MLFWQLGFYWSIFCRFFCAIIHTYNHISKLKFVIFYFSLLREPPVKGCMKVLWSRARQSSSKLTLYRVSHIFYPSEKHPAKTYHRENIWLELYFLWILVWPSKRWFLWLEQILSGAKKLIMIVKVVFTPFIYQPSLEAECVKRAKKKPLMGFWWRTLFANLAADSSRFFSSWWKSSLLQPLLSCTKFSFSENPSSNPVWFNMITKSNDRVFIENGLDQKYVYS